MKRFKNSINTIFLSIMILMLFILPSVGVNSDFSNTIDINNETDVIKLSKLEIMVLINEIEDKIVEIDTTIGQIDVVYWKHIVNDIEIKNDYILLQENPESKEMIGYDIQWRDINNTIFLEFKPSLFEPVNYSWKKKVAFLTEKDDGNFYTFYETQEHPVICWEVRYSDGETILYDTNGNEIGYGIPAPSQYGFSLSGYHNDEWPDAWRWYRENAYYWFEKWCENSVSISHPSTSTISSYVKDSNNIYFYELAHGNSYRFQNSKYEKYKSTAWFGTNLENDMKNRPAMRFAFIGSCDGMDYTGDGSFSYEFRKGSMTDTVTIGFDGMGSCPGWEHAWQWQNYMFNKMDENYTIKHAFDLACARCPEIAPCVVFKGDETIKIFEPKREAKLAIYLDKEFYSPGENVNITASNIGDEILILNEWYIEHKIFDSWEIIYNSSDFPGKTGYPYIPINDTSIIIPINNTSIISPTGNLTIQFPDTMISSYNNETMIIIPYPNDDTFIEPYIIPDEINPYPDTEPYSGPKAVLVLFPGQQITWTWPQIKNDGSDSSFGEYRVKVEYNDKTAVSNSFNIAYYLKFKEPVNSTDDINIVIEPIENNNIFLNSSQKLYNLSETPYLFTEEVSFPDSIYVYDGFLIDYENDGTYDVFQSLKYDKMTYVELDKNGNYLIDVDDDGEWDYTFNAFEGQTSPYTEIKGTSTGIPGFELIFVIIAIALILIWKKNSKK